MPHLSLPPQVQDLLALPLKYSRNGEGRWRCTVDTEIGMPLGVVVAEARLVALGPGQVALPLRLVDTKVPGHAGCGPAGPGVLGVRVGQEIDARCPAGEALQIADRNWR